MFFEKFDKGKKTVKFEDLPIEVFLIVVSFLDSRSHVDLMSVNKYFLTIVCQGFFKHSKENKVFIPNSALRFFLSNIRYEFDEISLYSENFKISDGFMSGLSKFLNKMKGFNSLHLNLKEVSFSKFLKCCKKFACNLRKLSLKNFWCEKPILISLLSSCVQLEKIRIENCKLKKFEQPTKIDSKLKKLNSVHIISTSKFIEIFSYVVPEKLFHFKLKKSMSFELDFQKFKEFVNLKSLYIETGCLIIRNWNKTESLRLNKLKKLGLNFELNEDGSVSSFIPRYFTNDHHYRVIDENGKTINKLDNLIDFNDKSTKLEEIELSTRIFTTLKHFNLSLIEKISFFCFVISDFDKFLGEISINLKKLRLFKINRGRMSHSSIVSLLVCANNLRELNIRNITLNKGEDNWILLSKEGLRKLEKIIFYYVSDIDLGFIYNLICYYQISIRKIRMLKCTFTSSGMFKDVDVELIYPQNDLNEVIKTKVTGLQQLNNLNEMNFNESRNFGILLNRMNEKVKNFPSLSYFSVNNTRIKQESEILSIESILSKSIDLHVFECENVPISNLNIKSEMLKELIISGAKINEEKLVESLINNKNLVKLKQTSPPIITKRENFLKIITGKRFLTNISINLQNLEENIDEILKAMMKHTPTIQQVIISGRYLECSAGVLENFLLGQCRLTLFVMDFCPLKNNLSEIDRIKKKIRKMARSAPRIILPIGLKKSYERKKRNFEENEKGCTFQ